ncbi:MAG: diguanylate cyclase domain-containing protein [Paracoccaceae bacterium]
MLNLSFGIYAAEAVREYELTISDFAPTDLTVELLYLFEAKSVVMEEIAQLNGRLTTARLAAEENATTDVLTGLKNRRAMDQILAGLVVSNSNFGLMHLDLDYFKDVNDTFGHAVGDAVLQAAAQVLRDETREKDTVARVGGDEFVLIFKDIVDETRLLGIADRIVARLEVPIEFQGKICRASGSIGITTSSFNETLDAGRMMSDADVALYASKHRGRACATVVTNELLNTAD